MSDTPNKWALPEFGLVTHAHHTTNKKMKLCPTLNPALKQTSVTPASYHEGFDKGYADGMNKALNDMSAQKNRLEALIQQIQTDNNDILLEREQALFGFVKSLCERILHSELSLSTETVKSIISQALKMIDTTGNEIRIFCHQTLYEHLQGVKFDSYNRVVFEVNNQLPEFEFTIESEKQKICFSVEKLLSKLLDEIKLCNSPK